MKMSPSAKVSPSDVQAGYDAHNEHAATARPSPMASREDRRWTGVATPAVAAGVTAVPPQSTSWSCGINGAARALAMMGRPIADYSAFMAGAPKIELLSLQIGPAPDALAAYVCQQKLDGPCAPGQACRAVVCDEAPDFVDALRRGWARGRCSLVLVRPNTLQLHWVVALGTTGEGDVSVLDSDGRIKDWPDGQRGLQQQSDLQSHLGFQLGLLQPHGIGRFNLLSF